MDAQKSSSSPAQRTLPGGPRAKRTRSKPTKKAPRSRRRIDDEDDEPYRTLFGKAADGVRASLAALNPAYEDIATSLRHRGCQSRYQRRSGDASPKVQRDIEERRADMAEKAGQGHINAMEELYSETDRDLHLREWMNTARACLTRALVGPHIIAREVIAARAGLHEYRPELRAALDKVAELLKPKDGEDNRRAAEAMDRIWLAAGYAESVVLHPFGHDGCAADDGDFLRLLPSSGTTTSATIASLPLPGQEPMGFWGDHGKRPGAVIGFVPHEQQKDGAQ